MMFILCENSKEILLDIIEINIALKVTMDFQFKMAD